MSFDLSRVSFDPLKDYLGVVMQQGRVQLDADWNEAVAQVMRRMTTQTLDTFGDAVVPRETPEGFEISLAGGSLSAGPGRLYVHGILAENHQAEPLNWDRRLGEQRGQGPVAYTAQPYYPQPPPLPAAGTSYLVYLDVWQREISRLQDPSLIEKAVGVDTTGRMQTVWQVKTFPVSPSVTSATPEADINGWLEWIHPSSGRLSSATADPPDEPDPCLLPPAAGYRGLENQLYRVEVHDGGGLDTATFKWSRDNATVMAAVTEIPQLDQIVVDTVGRDGLLRFNDGDFVEITDDARELHGEPGELRRVRLGGGVDDATRTIFLEAPLGAGDFPVDAQGRPDPSRHTRLRRWDQSGIVRTEAGAEHVDLDDPLATGAIPLPPPGTSVFLEDGIVVSFDLEATGEAFAPDFNSGDFWLIAARSVDASIDLLNREPPIGIHHHYAKLALVDADGGVSDCRVLWPPVVDGHGCDCTVCVTPEGHNSGAATIQQALDSVAATGGTICLDAGVYRIEKPLSLNNAGAVRIRGQGWRTELFASTPMDLLTVSNAQGIALENFSASSAAGTRGHSATLVMDNVAMLDIDACNILNVASADSTSIALRLAGASVLATIQNSVLMAERGVDAGESGKTPFASANLSIRHNVFLCSQRALSFEGPCFHLGQIHAEDNLVVGTREAAMVFSGAVIEEGDLRIEGNSLSTEGDGIRVGVDRVRIIDNDIYGPRERSGGTGIVLEEGYVPDGIEKLHIIGNRISRLAGHGIDVQARLRIAIVKQNQIERVSGAGFLMSAGGAAEILSFENNHIIAVGGGLGDTGQSTAAVFLQAVRRADVTGNVIAEIAGDSADVRLRAGLVVVGCEETAITGNRVFAIGPGSFGGQAVGTLVVGSSTRISVSGNSIARGRGDDTASLSVADWRALLIFGGGDQGQTRSDNPNSAGNEAGRPAGAAASTGGVNRRTADGAAASPSAAIEAGAQDAAAEIALPTSKAQVTVIGGTALLSLNDGILMINAAAAYALPPIAQSVCVSDNRFSGESASRTFVEILGVRSAQFLGNDCDAVTETERSGPSVAVIHADHGIVSNNRFMGIYSSKELERVDVQARQYTILGNFADGPMFALGVPIGAPWKDLNQTI